MRELNSSLAPHLELWIVISLNFLKILYQKFLEKSNFQMVLLRRFELLPEDWESSVLANLTKGAYGGPGWCRSTYSQRKRVYSPPQLPICYWPIYGGSGELRYLDITLNRRALCLWATEPYNGDIDGTRTRKPPPWQGGALHYWTTMPYYSSFRVVTALLPSPSIFIPRIDVLILSPLLDEVMFLLCCVVIWLAQILEYDHNGTPKGTRTPICSVKGCRPKPVSRWAHIIVAIYVRWATTPPRH